MPPFLLAVLIAANAAHAQWEQTPGPVGWTVTDMLPHAGMLFAITDHGCVFRSADDGVTWNRCGTATAGSAWGAARLSGHGGLLIATTWDGIRVSSDRGDSWEAAFGGRLPEKGLSLAWIGDQPFVLTTKGCCTTTDGGNTWSLAREGIPAFIPSYSRLIAAGGDLFLLCDKLYRSPDRGAHWFRADTLLPGNAVTDVLSSPPAIIMARYDNTYTSTDGGAHWTPASPALPGMYSLWAACGAVYADDGADVFRSTDAGASWERVPGLHARFWTSGALSLMPGETGLQASGDGGITWRQHGTAPVATSVEALATDGACLAALTARTRIHLSPNDGRQWIPLANQMQSYHLYCLAYADQNLLAGGTCSSGGIELSDNNGAQWVRVSDTLGSLSRIQAEAMTVHDGVVYAAGNGVWSSANAGRSWTLSHAPVSNEYFSALASDGSVLYAAGNALLRATAGASGWETLLPRSQLYEFRSVAACGRVLLAGGYGNGREGVFRSEDSGRTWTRAAIAQDSTVNHFVVSGSCIFAATERAGILCSLDSGRTWTDANDGSDVRCIRRLLLKDGVLYAGTAGHGVWKCVVADLITSVTPPPSALLEQNYPNPCNGVTSIRYALPASGHAVLRVCDMLGRVLSVVVDATREAGRYTAEFATDALPSGTYLIILESPPAILTRRMSVLH